MDYINIIATGAIVLFPANVPSKESSVHYRSFSSSSNTSLDGPTTPTGAFPRPAPVTMPIHSIMHSDNDCAYYLLTHVLTHPSMFPSSLQGVAKEAVHDAEVMVWSEIDKAKMFIRALGEWYAAHPEGINESQLEKLAGAWGLAWKSENENENNVKESGAIDDAFHSDSAVIA